MYLDVVPSVHSASVYVSRASARSAWSVGFSSIASIGACAPFARLGRGIFGAQSAISYVVVIFLMISSAITGLLSDCPWVVLVWQGKGSLSLILVHVLWWRNLRSSAMNLFILSVTGRPSVRSETWLPTDLAIVCLFTSTFCVLPGFKFGRFLSKTASFVCCSRGACFHQLWSSPVCFSYFLEVAPTVFIAAVALSSPRTIGLVVNMGLAPLI